MKESLYIGWDNSNIWLCGRNFAAQSEPGRENSFRISFKNLLSKVQDDREIRRVFIGGSIPPNNDPVWDYLKKVSPNACVEKQERGACSNGEVAVDEIIQKDMLEFAIDNIKSPCVFLLLSGDGAGKNQGKGFIPTLERVMELGHSIEVAAWSVGLNPKLKDFAETRGKLILLDADFNTITFFEPQSE